VNAFDLDNPLRLDDCPQCGAVHWRDCVCVPAVREVPNESEIEAARDSRLSCAERDTRAS